MPGKTEVFLKRLNFRAISTLSTLKIKVFLQRLLFSEFCTYLDKKIETLIKIFQIEYIFNYPNWLFSCIIELVQFFRHIELAPKVANQRRAIWILLNSHLTNQSNVYFYQSETTFRNFRPIRIVFTWRHIQVVKRWVVSAIIFQPPIFFKFW